MNRVTGTRNGGVTTCLRISRGRRQVCVVFICRVFVKYTIANLLHIAYGYCFSRC